MSEETLEVFNPTQGEISTLVKEAEQFTDVDIHDPAQISSVKECRLKLRNARTTIVKVGKSAREQAQAYAKSIIEKEKELVAQLTPEEERLKGIEEDSAQAILMEEREREMPDRLQRITELADGADRTREEVLAMDNVEFEVYMDKAKADKNQKIVDEMEAKQGEADRKKREKQEEKEQKKRLEEAKKLGEEQAIEKLRLEKEQAEEEAERQRVLTQKRKGFVEWRDALGWTKNEEHNFHIAETPTGFVMFKKVGEEFKK